MFTHRFAVERDLPRLRSVMAAAIHELQLEFLSDEQVRASHEVMGLDTQLIADRTYFVVEESGSLAGCGGWSRRATLYGGDHSQRLRDPSMLDPKWDAARIRAMYTHPDFVRRGVGRLILQLCEQAAAQEGFRRMELMGTMAGEPLYKACGYEEIERVSVITEKGIAVPLVRMGKSIQSVEST